jgi:hypothetical protein
MMHQIPPIQTKFGDFQLCSKILGMQEGENLKHGGQLVGQTLNNNKLNVALGSTHLQYNAQHEKKWISFIILAQ